jgi:hypothetical protein
MGEVIILAPCAEFPRIAAGETISAHIVAELLNSNFDRYWAIRRGWPTERLVMMWMEYRPWR